jgi:hypothetical protein
LAEQLRRTIADRSPRGRYAAAYAARCPQIARIDRRFARGGALPGPFAGLEWRHPTTPMETPMKAQQASQSSRIAIVDLVALVTLAAGSGIATAIALAGAALLLAA